MGSLWLFEAAAAATAFIITFSYLPSWEWNGVNLAATALNVSGSALAGLVNGGASVDNTAEMRTATSIFLNGFLAVWTSLGFTMEHAAQLAVVRSEWWGLGYLLVSVTLGIMMYMVAYRLGRQWKTSRRVVDWFRRGPLAFFSGVEVEAILTAIIAAAWGGWAMGQRAERLGWGVSMAIVGGMIGSWFSRLNNGQEGRINWGDWRCNALAFAGAVTACRYVATFEPHVQVLVLESAFFQALVSEGFGTISGFSDLAADVGDPALRGDYMGAAANLALNLVIAIVALLARMRSEIHFIAGRQAHDQAHDEL